MPINHLLPEPRDHALEAAAPAVRPEWTSEPERRVNESQKKR